MYASVDAFEQRQLNEIITEGQLDQWKAALGSRNDPLEVLMKGPPAVPFRGP